MKKNSRKILPSFVLTAVLVIAGGFSDGMNAQAKSMAMDSDLVPSQTMHIVSNKSVLSQDMPVDNSLKPCCVDRRGGATAIQASAFNQDMKISALGLIENNLDNNFVFGYKVSELSSASPPRPDVLSSVLKKE
jgi:hypothetical protein